MILKKYLDKNFTKEEQSNLIELRCSSEGITSLEGIEHLVKLEYLFCANNKLTSLKGIDKLVNLQVLYCSSNKLTSLKEIVKLYKLKELYCNNNPFPYTNLFILDKIKLEVIKEVRQYKIQKMLLL